MSEELGYIYRIARADKQQLHELITRHVGAGSTFWTFGGAAQWDFKPDQGSENLREIKLISSTGEINVSGDFGHAFNRNAEVRWKRRDDGGYDVLVLSEHQQTVEQGQPLRVRCWNSQTNDWEERDWGLRHYTKAAIVQGDKRPAIGYIDYLAPNGAVQFQRLVEVR